MAVIKRLVETNQLKLDRLEKIAKAKHINQKVFMNYDDSEDTLMVLFVDPSTPTVVHYIDDDMALLYEPDTLNVVGIQVENFENKFMSRYASVAQTWSIECEGEINMGVMLQVTEEKKPEIAQEVAKIADDIVSGQTGHRTRVPVVA